MIAPERFKSSNIHKTDRGEKMPYHGTYAWSSISRAPQKSRLCEGLCHMSTKQSSNSQNKSTPLLHHNPRHSHAIPANCNGPHYGPTRPPRKRCDSHHSWSWLFTSSNIPLMFLNDHWSSITQLYLENVYKWFGLPTKMISNWDQRFTSHFRKALMRKLRIKKNLSSVFHPQTDGLSEWKNQWVEQYLWLITSASPKSWMSWLTIALAVHNNRKNLTTGLLPNQILLRYETILVPKENLLVINLRAKNRIQILMNNRAKAVDAINKVAKQLEAISSQYHIGDQVWLEATHLLLQHQKTKLASKRYGPFLITKEISPVAYHIELSVSWNHTQHFPYIPLIAISRNNGTQKQLLPATTWPY